MVKKKVIIKKKKEVKKSDVKQTRKEYLRENLIAHLMEVAPESDRSFDIFEVCEDRHSRGSFREYMDGDFMPEDIKIFKEIMQDLKNEGFLFHKAGKWWARLEQQ